MRNYIALAIPLFFVFIGVELWVARKRHLHLYRLTDSMVDLSSGTLQQVLLIFTTPLLIWAYSALWQHRLVDLSVTSPGPWLIAFFGVDLAYYWWHRLSHEVNFLWASHVTHHQSEEYNLSVALRQSITSAFTNLPFALPLALLGVPPIVYGTIASFNTLYQFWIHTELIGDLGFVERVFNTPSQHRVHHAINPRYLDRNYGATLCVWDRIFGTFERETEPCVYGLVKPLASFQPLWAQVHRYVELCRMSWTAPGFDNKLRVWLVGPAGGTPGLPPPPPPPEVSNETRKKYDPQVEPGLRRYLWLQLVLGMSGAFVLLFFQNQLPRPVVGGGAVLIGLTLASWGGLIEARRWALPFEAARLLLVCAGAIAALHPVVPLPALVAGALVVTGAQAALLAAGKPSGERQAALQ